MLALEDSYNEAKSMKNDFDFLQASGFLSKRKLSFDLERNLLTSKFGRGMRSGSRRVRSIGMVLQQPQP
ncbi:hypothetical protein CDG79_05000 [Nostoc sp. 'Peltigera membranacea cyanobiont' 232]|nr:hypothetical protein CDG79_05000 [Nostoc sp. 'Peltigera membranacea cyanobiont' 232]